MELIDSLTISRVSRILEVPKEVLFEDACEDILSLAIRVNSTAPKLYENAKEKAGSAENFNFSGHYRYIYLSGNFLVDNKK